MTRLERCVLAKEKGYTYDAETGKIFGMYGKELTGKDTNGYGILRLYPKDNINFQIKLHHFAWYVIYGNVDFIELDHIDGNIINNKISNLRIATRQLQNRNKKSTNGYFWDKSRNKWLARIFIDRKAIYLGRFDTEEEARNAYLEGKDTYWDKY
jgi:hypothetical protein